VKSRLCVCGCHMKRIEYRDWVQFHCPLCHRDVILTRVEDEE